MLGQSCESQHEVLMLTTDLHFLSQKSCRGSVYLALPPFIDRPVPRPAVTPNHVDGRPFLIEGVL